MRLDENKSIKCHEKVRKREDMDIALMKQHKQIGTEISISGLKYYSGFKSVLRGS